MTNAKTVADLFQEKPWQWGLRGDPYLWNEMRNHFEQSPLPATANELTTMIETAFETLTGQPVTAENHFYIDRTYAKRLRAGKIKPS